MSLNISLTSEKIARCTWSTTPHYCIATVCSSCFTTKSRIIPHTLDILSVLATVKQQKEGVDKTGQMKKGCAVFSALTSVSTAFGHFSYNFFIPAQNF